MAASILVAAGQSAMVTHTVKEYQDLARDLFPSAALSGADIDHSPIRAVRSLLASAKESLDHTSLPAHTFHEHQRPGKPRGTVFDLDAVASWVELAFQGAVELKFSQHHSESRGSDHGRNTTRKELHHVAPALHRRSHYLDY